MAQATTFSIATLAVVRSPDSSVGLKLRMLTEDLVNPDHPLATPDTRQLLFEIVDYYEKASFRDDLDPSMTPAMEMLVDTLARDFDDRSRITVHSAMVMRARIGSLQFRLEAKDRRRHNADQRTRAA